jgi:hypothetical protein
MAEVRPGRPVKRAVLGVLGGAAVVGGVFLPWIVSDGFTIGTSTVSQEILGSELDYGTYALAAGGVAIVVALLLVAALRLRTVWSVLLVLAGAVAVALAVLVVVDIQTQYVDVAIAEARVPADQEAGVRISLQALFDGGVGVDPGLGLWLSLGGGVLALVAGAASLIRSRSDDTFDAEPAEVFREASVVTPDTEETRANTIVESDSGAMTPGTGSFEDPPRASWEIPPPSSRLADQGESNTDEDISVDRIREELDERLGSAQPGATVDADEAAAPGDEPESGYRDSADEIDSGVPEDPEADERDSDQPKPRPLGDTWSA